MLISFTTFNSSLNISCFAIVVKIYVIYSSYRGSIHIARNVITVPIAKCKINIIDLKTFRTFLES